MAHYLKFAGAVLDKVESDLLTRRIILQLNDAQCSRLLRNLRKTHDHFYQSLLFPTRTLRRKCLPFYKELYRIVEHTEATVKECSKPDWLEAAIMQAGNQEVFIQMSRKLHFCINGFTETVEAALHICSDIALSALSVAVEQHEMDEDFRRDSLKFMERLKKVVKQQVSEDTIKDPSKHQLAEYLIDREHYLSSTNLDLYTSLPQFYVAKREYPRVGEPIGSGSAGSVLKVRWLGLECAKKHFATNHDESSSPRKLELMKEVSALVHLNHPHIVKLLCVSTDREVSFLMELMPMSLHNFIQKRWKGQEYVPFALAAATDIMLQIALGMEHLHGKGVVHRDLKSQNILVTPSACEGLSDEGYGHIKVTDFGLSKTLIHELTEPTGILGTTRWMAPEVLGLKKSLKPKIDWRKADTYSFAMTCSEIVTGATPFSEVDCTIAMLLERITKGGERPELPLACPKFLASLLTQCWDPNPALRPSFTEICKGLQLLQGYLFRGSELIHKSWSPAETSSMGETSALRSATTQEQDILVKVGLSSSKKSKLDMFFRSSKIFRSQLKLPSRRWEVSSSIFMGNFPQPVGLRGVQVFEYSSLYCESTKELESRTVAKWRYFVEGMKALIDNPHNHLVKLQYWHYSSFSDSDQNRLYVVYDAWSSTLDEHLSGLKKTLPWNKRLHILAGFMACVVYFMELIELNVISSISLSTKSILLDKSYNLHFTDVSLVLDAGCVSATDKDNLEGMVYEIGLFIMKVLCGIRKDHIDTLHQYARGGTQPGGLQWVKGFMDPRLNTGYHTGQAGTLLTLGLDCLNPNENARPTIWLARDIITSTVDLETKLTRSQGQGQSPALPFLEYKAASEYTCQEVREITSNFSTAKRYGKYLGTLPNGEKVLVEQLPPSSASPEEFVDQVHFLMKYFWMAHNHYISSFQ